MRANVQEPPALDEALVINQSHLVTHVVQNVNMTMTASQPKPQAPVASVNLLLGGSWLARSLTRSRMITKGAWTDKNVEECVSILRRVMFPPRSRAMFPPRSRAMFPRIPNLPLAILNAGQMCASRPSKKKSVPMAHTLRSNTFSKHSIFVMGAMRTSFSVKSARPTGSVVLITVSTTAVS